MNQYLVVGYGVSGRAAVELLKRTEECKVYVYDASGFARTCDEFETVKLGKLTRKFFSGIKTVVISPAVPISQGYLTKAAEAGAEVIGEVEFGYRHCKASVIAVTGTNGKTTTTAMIESILQSGGKKCHALGNIGKAFCEAADSLCEDGWVALETSSFQLESVVDFRPKIALMLNLSPDHLDRHMNMENYARQKLRIAVNQRADDFLVLNADDVSVKYYACADNILSDVYFVSLRSRVRGVYVLDNKIYFEGEEIMDVYEFRLPGLHNLYNALFAVAAAKLAGVDNGSIRSSLISFKAVKHRLELAGESGMRKFYNDSKATNIDSTLRAVNALGGEIALILGGSDKGYEYDELFYKMPERVQYIAVIGETAGKILAAAKRCRYDWGRIAVFKTLEAAVKGCHMSGFENILLSPASASFDMFDNYEHRGEVFCEIIKKYTGKQ